MIMAHLASHLLGSWLPIVPLAESARVEEASADVGPAASKAFFQLTGIEPTERREFIWG